MLMKRGTIHQPLIPDATLQAVLKLLTYMEVHDSHGGYKKTANISSSPLGSIL